MNFTIFSKLTIDDRSAESALSDIQKYQQLAAHLRQRYHSLNSIVPLIDDEEEAKEVSFAVTVFNQEFNSINQEVSRFTQEKERNLNKALEAARKYDGPLNKIEAIYQKHRDKIASVSPQLEAVLQELLTEQSQYVNNLNTQWSALQNKLSDQIEKGIESLLEVKLTQGITGAFKDQITNEIQHNQRAEKIYFFLFVVTLLLIPASIVGVYFVEPLKTLEWGDLLLIKLAIAAPLIWVARWFSKNYAHARLASIKFDHLNRLLGEGANTIAKLVEVDATAKAEVYRRFAELFLDIKDLESIAVKQPKHPIEDIKEIVEIQKRLHD